MFFKFFALFCFVVEFAVIIKKLVGGKNKIEQGDAVEDDPQRRKPDITRAMTYLNWKPRVCFFFNKKFTCYEI